MTYIYILIFVNHLFCIECWQDDPGKRPDIQHVETRMIRMISGSNMVDNNEQENEENRSFSHFSTNLTGPTSDDLFQENIDDIIKNFDKIHN